MPIIQELIDYRSYYDSLKFDPIIVNNIKMEDDVQRNKIKGLIKTTFTSDVISTISSCHCGETKGEDRVGRICRNCKTPVESKIDIDFDPLLWFKQPEGVEKLISPYIWTLLFERFRTSRKKFSVMQWLTDTTYRCPNVTLPPIVDRLISHGVCRGYNYFVQNFDAIIELLFNDKDFVFKKKKDYLYELIVNYRHLIFTDILPLPNKAIIIIEKTKLGTYVIAPTGTAVNTILMITGVDAQDSFTLRDKQNRTAKAIHNLSRFLMQTVIDFVSQKPGLIRKNLVASRTFFTFRAVVTSITRPHDYEEVHIPWGVGLAVFRPHLINKLSTTVNQKTGRYYSLNEAVDLLHSSAEVYNPLLDDLLKELIKESPYKGIPVIEQRNPSLLSGSAELKYITIIKTDPNDRTVSTSALTLKAKNCDTKGIKRSHAQYNIRPFSAFNESA